MAGSREDGCLLALVLQETRSLIISLKEIFLNNLQEDDLNKSFAGYCENINNQKCAAGLFLLMRIGESTKNIQEFVSKQPSQSAAQHIFKFTEHLYFLSELRDEIVHCLPYVMYFKVNSIDLFNLVFNQEEEKQESIREKLVKERIKCSSMSMDKLKESIDSLEKLSKAVLAYPNVNELVCPRATGELPENAYAISFALSGVQMASFLNAQLEKAEQLITGLNQELLHKCMEVVDDDGNTFIALLSDLSEQSTSKKSAKKTALKPSSDQLTLSQLNRVCQFCKLELSQEELQRLSSYQYSAKELAEWLALEPLSESLTLKELSQSESLISYLTVLSKMKHHGLSFQNMKELSEFDLSEEQTRRLRKLERNTLTLGSMEPFFNQLGCLEMKSQFSGSPLSLSQLEGISNLLRSKMSKSAGLISGLSIEQLKIFLESEFDSSQLGQLHELVQSSKKLSVALLDQWHEAGLGEEERGIFNQYLKSACGKKGSELFTPKEIMDKLNKNKQKKELQGILERLQGSDLIVSQLKLLSTLEQKQLDCLLELQELNKGHLNSLSKLELNPEQRKNLRQLDLNLFTSDTLEKLYTFDPWKLSLHESRSLWLKQEENEREISNLPGLNLPLRTLIEFARLQYGIESKPARRTQENQSSKLTQEQVRQWSALKLNELQKRELSQLSELKLNEGITLELISKFQDEFEKHASQIELLSDLRLSLQELQRLQNFKLDTLRREVLTLKSQLYELFYTIVNISNIMKDMRDIVLVCDDETNAARDVIRKQANDFQHELQHDINSLSVYRDIRENSICYSKIRAACNKLIEFKKKIIEMQRSSIELQPLAILLPSPKPPESQESFKGLREKSKKSFEMSLRYNQNALTELCQFFSSKVDAKLSVYETFQQQSSGCNSNLFLLIRICEAVSDIEKIYRNIKDKLPPDLQREGEADFKYLKELREEIICYLSYRMYCHNGNVELFNLIFSSRDRLIKSDRLLENNERILDSLRNLSEILKIILENNDNIAMNYDLCEMSEEVKKDWIAFECKPEGFEYKVLGLDNQQRTATIPWSKFPEDFPKEDKEVLEEKERLLPMILKITSEAGHTPVELSKYIPKKDRVNNSEAADEIGFLLSGPQIVDLLLFRLGKIISLINCNNPEETPSQEQQFEFFYNIVDLSNIMKNMPYLNLFYQGSMFREEFNALRQDDLSDDQVRLQYYRHIMGTILCSIEDMRIAHHKLREFSSKKLSSDIIVLHSNQDNSDEMKDIVLAPPDVDIAEMIKAAAIIVENAVEAIEAGKRAAVIKAAPEVAKAEAEAKDALARFLTPLAAVPPSLPLPAAMPGGGELEPLPQSFSLVVHTPRGSSVIRSSDDNKSQLSSNRS